MIQYKYSKGKGHHPDLENIKQINFSKKKGSRYYDREENDKERFF